MKYEKMFKKAAEVEDQKGAFGYEEGEARERASAKRFWENHELAMTYVNKIRKLCDDIESETYEEAIEDLFDFIVSSAENGKRTIRGI